MNIQMKGFGKKEEKGFCHLALFTRHLRLSFHICGEDRRRFNGYERKNSNFFFFLDICLLIFTIKKKVSKNMVGIHSKNGFH